VARGGGILLDPDGLTELAYSWGLGVGTNNIAEALALWQGLQQSLRLRRHNLVVFGDSKLIIQALVTSHLPKQLKLKHLIRKIRALLSSFNLVKFYHVLRTLNGEADHAANVASTMNKGSLRLNVDDELHAPLP